jgi:hypothetical protein
MKYQFILDSVLGEEEIINPIGWEDISLMLVRDQYHGVSEGFPAKFQYHSDGYTHLKELWDTYGLQAECSLTVNYKCSETDSWTLLFEGVFDFSAINIKHSDCIIEIPAEPSSCRVKFINRFEEKVEIPTASTITVPTKTILKTALLRQDGADTVNQDDPYTHQIDDDADAYMYKKSLIPFYANNLVIQDSPFDLGTAPIFVEEGNCWDRTVPYTCDNSVGLDRVTEEVSLPIFTAEIAGDYTIKWDVSAVATVNAVLTNTAATHGAAGISADGNPAGFESAIFQLEYQVWSSNPSHQDDSFLDSDSLVGNYNRSQDYTMSVAAVNSGFTIPLDAGDKVSLFFQIVHGAYYWAGTSPHGGTGAYNVTLNQKIEVLDGSYFSVVLDDSDANPPITASMAMVDVALDSVIDEISDGCLSLNSEYYGRTDGVNTTASDGCGGLRAITTGLKVRQFPAANLYASMKQLYENLNAIDNIGLNILGSEVIVENVKEFYSDTVAISFDNVPNIQVKFDEGMVINNLIIGYSKWESEEFNGLDEFNTKREYSNGITQTRGNKTIQSDFIASAYAAEITKRNPYLGNSTKDFKYDNDLFIFCLKRDSGLVVDQGNITSDANIIDPSTIYNYAISPARNAIRWFKSVITGIKDATSAVLSFKYGEGNYTAEGNYTGDCSVEEDGVLSESQNIEYADITSDHKEPLFTGELIIVEDQKLSKSEYDTIKANATQVIRVRKDSSSSYLSGWIKELKYSHKRGTVKMTLIKKP